MLGKRRKSNANRIEPAHELINFNGEQTLKPALPSDMDTCRVDSSTVGPPVGDGPLEECEDEEVDTDSK